MTVNAGELSSQIVNARCYEFRFVEGGTLILYLAIDSPESSRARLWIDCAWRLKVGTHVRVGSLDEPAIVLEVLQGIKGRSVQSVSVADETGDLILSLDGDLKIESFGYSIVDEHWEFRRSDGLRLGIGPKFLPYRRFEDPDSSDQRGSMNET